MSRKWMFGGLLTFWGSAVAPRGVSDPLSGASSPGALAVIALLTSALLTTGCNDTSNLDPLPNMQVVKEIRGSTDVEADEEVAAAEEVTEETVTTDDGWGTLRGQFVLSGDAPSLANLSATKDTEVCGKVPLIDETLVVGDEGGIANIVVYAFKTNRVHQEALDAALAETALFDQQGCKFLSHVLPVVVGQTVTLKNSDPVPHNTNISPQGDKSVNPLLPAGGEVQHTFGRRQSRPFAVSCSVHPWMKAYLFPRDDTYVAVSAADGTFEIANLPAGEEIQIRVWHEAASGGLEAKSDWGKGRFNVTITADGIEDLETIEVPVAAFSL